MTAWGYARIGLGQGTLDRQRAELAAAGCALVFTDTTVGAGDAVPGWDDLLSHVQRGDAVVVTSLDRLGIVTAAVIHNAQHVLARGLTLRSLRDGIDTSTEQGRVVSALLTTLADHERILLNERATAGRYRARADGRRKGRRGRVLTDQQARAVVERKEAGESVLDIAADLGVGESTLYEYLREWTHDVA